MDGDRKYSQRGYMDSGNQPNRDQKPRPAGPKPSLDITGPRLPRLVQTVTASRCFNCATTLPEGTDMSGQCPKCAADLHCCKQCAYFEPSTRFQCVKPVPERIAIKDKANQCELFSPRVTVARDVKAPAGAGPLRMNGNGPGSAVRMQEPRTPNDARAAFDSLFKKI